MRLTRKLKLEEHHTTAKIVAGLLAIVGLIVGIELDPNDQELVPVLWFLIAGLYFVYYSMVSLERGWIELVLARGYDGKAYRKEKPGTFYAIFWFQLFIALIFILIGIHGTMSEISGS